MRVLLALLTLTLLLGSFALKLPAPIAVATKPNVLFIIADDWGFPHAGVYGDAVVKTPHFDKLAREGILFTDAHCAAPFELVNVATDKKYAPNRQRLSG